jgi:hypothetical protein
MIATTPARARLARAVALLSTALLIASLLPIAPITAVLGAATVTPATGGGAIPATTAADAPSPAWTTIVGPQITEDAAGQLVTNGTIILTTPTGFEFKAATGTIAAGGTGCTGLTFGSLSFTQTTISVTVTAQSTAACVATYSGVQVRPINGTPLRSGNITNTGNTGPAGSTNYGTLTMVVGTASKLAVTQHPTTSPSAVAFAVQPVVAVQDAVGNTITADSTTQVTLSIKGGTPAAGGPGTLACTGGQAMTVTSGVATFAGCKITGDGIGYRLTGTDTSPAGGGHPYTAADSNLFDIPDNLGFEVQPGGGAGTGGKAQGGIAFTNQPKVVVRDGTANFTTNKAVNDDTTLVTLSIKNGTGTAGAVLTCDQAGNVKIAVDGVAQFSGCKIDKSGTGYKLVATSSPAYGSNAFESAAFDVVAGPATKLTFTTQPAGANAGQAFTTQPVVAITDAGGNVATTGVSANVTLAIGTNPGVPAGVLTCTPGNTVATATSGTNAGKAIFSGCKISNAGNGYILTAIATSIVPSTTALTAATSNAFNVGAPAASISVIPSASVITWGQTFAITTHFAVNGAGKAFALQRSLDGVTWVTQANLVTDALGNSVYVYKPRTNNYYRALFAGTSDLLAGTSNAARVLVREKAIQSPIHATTRTILRGAKVTFTTTVRPVGPDLPVAKVTFFIYRRVAGVWVAYTTRIVPINSLGQAKLTWTFSIRGEWYVRSRANPTTMNANSISTPIARYRVV